MELHQIDSLMDEMAERLPMPEPETDQIAPHELGPDVAIGDPRTFRNLKGTREKRLQRSGQADTGIIAPQRQFPSNRYPGSSRTKRGFILQKAGNE